jgi:hypothetical protein
MAIIYQWYNLVILIIMYFILQLTPLTITSVTNAMNGFKYRVQLNKSGNSCGLLSSETTLTVYPLPVVDEITDTM